MAKRLCISGPLLGEMIRYTTDCLPVEAGGIMMGKVEEAVVRITEFLPALSAGASAVSIHFSHRTWLEMARARRGLPVELSMCGWFHSHPGLGVFLSAEDYQIHQDFYRYHYQAALVIDPLRQELAWFGWHEGSISSVPVVVEGGLALWPA